MKAQGGSDSVSTEAGYFVYELTEGSQATGTVLLSNTSDREVVVDMTAVDALTAGNGGSAFATGQAPVQAVGLWIQLSEPEVTLAPDSEREVEFSIQVPADTTPGQYLAGLAAAVQPEESDATPTTIGEEQASVSIDLRTRYVIGVQIDVPGEWTPSLQIETVELIDQPSGPVVGVVMHNDGDTFLRPTGLLTVTDAQGQHVVLHPIEMGTFVTGTSVVYPVPWPGGPSAGEYQVEVSLAFGDDQTVAYSGELTVEADGERTITVGAVEVTESRASGSDTLDFVDVAISIDNSAEPITNAQVTLHVMRDGEAVESLVLVSAMTLQTGTSMVNQRYFPPGGWQEGRYSFTVTVQTVDPATGNTVDLATGEAESQIEVSA